VLRWRAAASRPRPAGALPQDGDGRVEGRAAGCGGVLGRVAGRAVGCWGWGAAGRVAGWDGRVAGWPGWDFHPCGVSFSHEPLSVWRYTLPFLSA
jgi:hypothetical protein